MTYPSGYKPTNYLVIKERDSSVAFLAVTKLTVIGHDFGFRIKYFDKNFTITRLTSSDVETKRRTIKQSKNIRNSISVDDLTRVGTTYYDISHSDLMIILRNFVGTPNRVSKTLRQMEHLGVFSLEELREIYPTVPVAESASTPPLETDSETREARLKLLKFLESIKKFIRLDKTKRNSYLGYTVFDYLDLHGLDVPRKYPFFFYFDDQALFHTAIIGGSGSGKSVTAFVLIEDATHDHIPTLVLDPTEKLSSKTVRQNRCNGPDG